MFMALVKTFAVAFGVGSLALFHARALLEHGLLGHAIFDLASANAFIQLSEMRRESPSARILQVQRLE